MPTARRLARSWLYRYRPKRVSDGRQIIHARFFKHALAQSFERVIHPITHELPVVTAVDVP
jgi:hypothetical protein